MTHIPLYDLRTNRTSSVYSSGAWTDGTYIRKLEAMLSRYLNIPYVILTNSGTSALLAAYWVLRTNYRNLHVDPYTFPATYQPARLLGYDINFIQTILKRGYVYPRDGLKVITHLFGQPDHGVASRLTNGCIEDACQSFGAEHRGKKVGTFGMFGCFSFYPTKSLHTCGHGGALVTHDKQAYKEAKVFIESGRENGIMTESVALNLRMDEIKAEFLLQELPVYDQKIELQRAIAEEFKSVIPGEQLFLREESGDKHIYSVFNMCIDNRDNFREHMHKRDIQTTVYYDGQVLPSGQRQQYEELTSRVVAIPCRHNLKALEIKKIKQALREWF